MEGHVGGGGSSRPPAPPSSEAAKAGRSRRHEEVKVKHIVTWKVTTDEANFKDVVQRLTGKDSAAARAAVVAACADDATSWGGGGSGVNSSGAGVSHDYIAGAMILPSEEDMRWLWAGGGGVGQ